MEILLIRHGETAYNTEHRIYGHAQIPLNAHGQRQATAVAQRLAHTTMHGIYSSDLIRASATAHAIAAYHTLDVQLDAGFREVDVGDWEHLTETEVAIRDPHQYALFCQFPGKTAYSGGESFVQVQQRAWHALQRCIAAHHHGDTICVVCHAGTISTLICTALQVDIDHHPRLRIDNCAISRFVVTDDGLQLATFNDNTHRAMRTGE